jgi:hypothetical protein
MGATTHHTSIPTHKIAGVTPVSWPDEVDQIIGGDLTAVLAYLTPAGGAVLTAVAPIGLRDRDAGTVTFTTSLGFGRKLERIVANPRVALAYHAREHGFAAGDRYVLVQGRAEATFPPDRAYLETVIGPAADRFMGPRKRGRLFWDRWLQEYYADRVPVTVQVERIITWPDASCGATPSVLGESRPQSPPASHPPPAKGTSPRVDAERSTRRLRNLRHKLLGWVDADGYPFVAPVEVAGAGPEGIQLVASEGLLPPGARRAGLLAHEYRAKLIGLAARQHTGWLEVGERAGVHALYSPHTESGFRAPPNKTLLLFANGLLAKRGLRQARREGRETRLTESSR